MHGVSLTAVDPDKLALQFSDGPGFTYRHLDDISCRTANWLRSLGLLPGDHIALMSENRPDLVELCWGAQRSGLYYTLIPTHLKADEAAYIADDCGARLVATTGRHAALWRESRSRLAKVEHWACLDSEPDFTFIRQEVRGQPTEPVGSEFEGSAMLYSSGTTGRPKGIKRALSGKPFGQEPLSSIYQRHHNMDGNTIYLSPAPLYHAAPLRCVMAVHRLGGTVIALEKFDSEQLLRSIEQYRVTHVQLVPTMMWRIMDLPEDVRRRYDTSSLKTVIHAAAPCPIGLKQSMIDWLGPIVNEYYGGTEGVGVTYITSDEWLSHKGSVGRAILGEIHIAADSGEEVPLGQTGLVYFANGPAFEYHNAPEKLAEATHPRGWVTLGDIGRLDAEGYLYLVDRRSFTIVSGGVNIYPQEVEDTLRAHPDVADAAVFGVPNRDFGEEVKAVVELRVGASPNATTAAALIAFCRERISAVKCPRSIDFLTELPRSDSGKLLKGELKARYWRQSDVP